MADPMVFTSPVKYHKTYQCAEANMRRGGGEPKKSKLSTAKKRGLAACRRCAKDLEN